MAYNPPRQGMPKPTGEPLEIELVFNVRPCGTCSFFWPPNPQQQPYGPYPAYDFDANTPATKPPGPGASYAWVDGTTTAGCFPDAEIMDGCRKAPIMTIGINPNLTAFLPGTMGASWCYPHFSSDDGTDSWTKYAYYYRYRSIYQEHFDLHFTEQFFNQRARIVAAKAGSIVSADRPSDAPEFTLMVRYDGDTTDTSIVVPNKIGEPRYVLLFDPRPPHNRFQQGDAIAAQLDVPAGKKTTIYAEAIGYYQRIVPVLGKFEAFLESKGHHDAHLRVGEDVCQLDMVACASPHWGPSWLGGTPAKVQEVIGNCVTKNAWAIKQLLQTRPAVLYLVGEATFNMFRYAFGRLLQGDPPLPTSPQDGAFTLFRATTEKAYRFEFSGTVANQAYQISTRIVVTPHFSYGTNFLPQFRLSAVALDELEQKVPACVQFLQHDPRLQYSSPGEGAFAAFQIIKDAAAVLSHINGTWPTAGAILNAAYYDPDQMMAGVLQEAYTSGAMSYVAPRQGQPGYLARNEGPCTFCVNDHWKFPLGCPYGKPELPQLTAGWLNKVAAAIVEAGRPVHSEVVVRRMIDDGFEAARGAQSHS
jgi:hypothetical protein